MASLQELKAQMAEIQRVITEQETEERGKAIEQVRTLMETHGLRPADLGKRERGAPRGPSPTAGRKIAAKYRDPESGNAWSGRGQTPSWLRERLRDGKTKIEDFRVPEPA